MAGAAWLVVLVQLVFFAIRQPVWSPIDEYNHFFYVNYLYYAHRPPAVGVIYRGTTNPQGDPALAIPPSRGHGVAMPALNPATESIQPPAYYVAMLPAFATAPHLSYDQVTHVRLATALLAAVMVPLTFAVARLAAPTVPWVWGAASVLPALSRGYTFNLSQVTNDALAALVGSAALLLALWLMRRPLDWRWGLMAGLATGVAAVTKVTVFYVAIGFAVAFIVSFLRDRSWRKGLLAAALAVMVALVIPLPFLLLNLHRYHALTGSTGFPIDLRPYYNQSLIHALRLMLTLGSIKFWTGELAIPQPPLWMVSVGEVGLLICTAGLLSALWSRRRLTGEQGFVVAWTVSGVGYLVLLVLSTHVAVLTGRYVYPLFPGLATVSALGANRLGWPGRWLFLASAVVLAVLTAIGVNDALHWVLADCSNCAFSPG